MATRNEVGAARTGYALIRLFTCLLGLAAIAWGGHELPAFWQQAPLDRVASEILEGHTFKAQQLAVEVRQSGAAEHASYCNPGALHDAIAIRLAVLDDALASKSNALIDSAYSPLYSVTRTALSCAPADSFAWLTLFWLDLTKHGFTAENAFYLRLSYALGPNEGWIALRRSRLAIALFPRLPTDLKVDATDEFVKLVDTAALSSEMASLFAGAAPAVQGQLADALKSAMPIPRQILVQELSSRGLEINIPGVEREPIRPWE